MELEVEFPPVLVRVGHDKALEEPVLAHVKVVQHNQLILIKVFQIKRQFIFVNQEHL